MSAFATRAVTSLALFTLAIAVAFIRVPSDQSIALSQATATSPSGGIVAPGARIERLSTGYQFTEGPAPDQYGGLWFTDVFDSKIYYMSPGGGVTLYREATDRTNGLYFDADWNLIACEWYGRRVVRDDLNGGVTVVADSYDGKRLNGPNDVWVAPDGGIYFTDPTFGDVGEIEQDGTYVYYLPPDGAELRRVSGPMILPNGVVGTPDGQTLYVTDSHGPTWRFDIEPDGSLSKQTRFAAQGGDGMSVDERGNLYLAYQYDVWVYDSAGDLLQRITPPEPPANVAFGGPDGRTLFITAYTSIYSLEMAVRGALAPTVEPTVAPTAEETASPTPSAEPTATETPQTPETPTATSTPEPDAIYLPYGILSTEG
jgi:gluconolactonase